MLTIRAGRLLLVVALLSSLPLWPGGIAGQEKELTPQERKQLESEARRLNMEAITQFGKGKYREAIRSLEQALAKR